MSDNTTPDVVRMEFVGAQFGAVTYTVNGVSYRAGAAPSNKYVDARPEDVEGLEALGVFQVVKAPKEAATLGEQTTPIDTGTPGTDAATLEALPEDLAQKVIAAGFVTPDALKSATDETLLDIDGVGPAALKKIRDAYGSVAGETNL